MVSNIKYNTMELLKENIYEKIFVIYIKGIERMIPFTFFKNVTIFTYMSI